MRGALRRAASRLVRGNFWLVVLVLVPVEIVGDAIGEGARPASSTACSATPSSPPGSPRSVANIVLSPVFAVAAVLLTLDLIAEKDGDRPALKPRPAARGGHAA